MTADELYEFEARVGPSSEWEPLYRAEKARANAAEAKLAEVRAIAERWQMYDDRARLDARTILRTLGPA